MPNNVSKYVIIRLYFRFGDSELNKCEVMLKDIHDSGRIGNHLLSDPAYGIKDLVKHVK